MIMDNLSPEERNVILQMRSAQAAAPAAPPDAEPAPGQRRWGEFPPPNPPTVTRLIAAPDWVQKQLDTMSAVGQAHYSAGIARPKRDPIQAAIAAQPAYEAKMRDAAVLKRRETNLRKTNMNEWALNSETLGANRLVEGVMARRPKIERAVASLHSKLSGHLQRIDALPAVTDADRERRMVENLRGLRALKGTI